MDNKAAAVMGMTHINLMDYSTKMKTVTDEKAKDQAFMTLRGSE